MKTTNIFAVLIFMTVSFTAFGQELQKKPVNRINVRDIWIQLGYFNEGNSNGTLAEFKTLAPESVLLNNDMTGFSQRNGFMSTGTSVFSVMLGIQFSDKQKTIYKANPLLRIGISYFSGTSLTNSLFKEVRRPYDTLTSTQTGQTIYIDSVTTERYRMNYLSDQIRIDGSLIFRTNPEARWSWYAGIGISAGLSINAKTEISYDTEGVKETSSSSGGTSHSFEGYFGSDNRKVEFFRNKNNFGVSTYIPMGVDFRIGKKSEFWKMTHLFYELRPGINITSIPELRTMTNAYFQQGIGVRVSWN